MIKDLRMFNHWSLHEIFERKVDPIAQTCPDSYDVIKAHDQSHNHTVSIPKERYRESYEEKTERGGFQGCTPFVFELLYI
jgi:hypothetical protein